MFSRIYRFFRPKPVRKPSPFEILLEGKPLEVNSGIEWNEITIGKLEEGQSVVGYVNVTEAKDYNTTIFSDLRKRHGLDE